MKVGDLVKAVWYDGIILIGKYQRKNHRYVILLDKEGEEIACNPFYVRFEVINEARQ